MSLTKKIFKKIQLCYIKLWRIKRIYIITETANNILKAIRSGELKPQKNAIVGFIRNQAILMKVPKKKMFEFVREVREMVETEIVLRGMVRKVLGFSLNHPI